MKMRYLGLFVVFLLGIWGGNTVIKFKTANDAPPIKTSTTLNQHMSEFTLPDLKGVKHNITEWQGNVIILNFWATWCPPCQKETPLFVALQEEYGKRGVQFIGVAIDDLQKVVDFTDTYGVNYPMLVGAEDAISIAKQYGNRFGSLPYTVVINRQGKITYIQNGELKRDVAEKTINTLL